MTRIRSTLSADIPALAAIERSAGALFRGSHMAFASDDPPLDAATHEAGIADGTHWIVEVEGQPAGFCCAHIIDDVFYIDELAVAGEFQRMGLGRALMDAAIAEAKVGFSAVSLITDRELAWNGPFYASLGFAEWDNPHPALRRAMAEEIEAGFDPAKRCAMILRVG